MSIPYPRFTGSEPCRSTDPDAFFPIDGLNPGLARTLRGICGECEMQAPCAEWAIRHEQHGFWGGMTPNERSEYRKRYGIAFKAITWPYAA